MLRSLLIANWKMNLLHTEAIQAFQHIDRAVSRDHVPFDVVVCAPFVYLAQLSSMRSTVRVGAQNCFYETQGAFTGEISAGMLQDVAEFVLVGHSERRHYFGETDEIVARKVEAVLSAHLTPILCIGESAEDYHQGRTLQVLRRQLEQCLIHVPDHRRSSLVLAYEPLWAISTFATHPVTPNIDDLTSIGLWLRKYFVKKWGGDIASTIPILYGGSVDRSNIQAISSLESMNGALVGSASLHSQEFLSIVSTFADTVSNVTL